MDKKINDQLLKSIEKTEMPLISAFTISLFTIYTLSVSCYSVIAPFMPIEIVKKEVVELFDDTIIKEHAQKLKESVQTYKSL